MKTSITNKSDAPQGVYTARGISYIAPGATQEFDLDSDQLKRLRRLSFLSFGKRQLHTAEAPDGTEGEFAAASGSSDGEDGAEGSDGGEPSDAQSLLDDLEGGMHFMTFKKRAGEILGPANLPDTKDEIIEALKAKG